MRDLCDETILFHASRTSAAPARSAPDARTRTEKRLGVVRQSATARFAPGNRMERGKQNCARGAASSLQRRNSFNDAACPRASQGVAFTCMTMAVDDHGLTARGPVLYGAMRRAIRRKCSMRTWLGRTILSFRHVLTAFRPGDGNAVMKLPHHLYAVDSSTVNYRHFLSGQRYKFISLY